MPVFCCCCCASLSWTKENEYRQHFLSGKQCLESYNSRKLMPQKYRPQHVAKKGFYYLIYYSIILLSRDTESGNVSSLPGPGPWCHKTQTPSKNLLSSICKQVWVFSTTLIEKLLLKSQISSLLLAQSNLIPLFLCQIGWLFILVDCLPYP